MKRNFNLPKVDYDLVRLQGGMDQITPTLSLPPGTVRRSTNFECALSGGYSRVAGYERYDGHVSPSLAKYGVLEVNLTDSVAVGNTVTGSTSGATGRVIAVATGKIAVTRRTGIFVSGETITVSAVPVGVVSEVSGIDTDGLTDAQYSAMAANSYRTDIGAVPGEGDIRGVAYLNGTVFAWRNAVGSASMNIYKSTAAGWVMVTLGSTITFGLGTSEIFEGVTIVGVTSGATATVNRVMTASGAWTGTATGRLAITVLSGVFVSGEILKVSGVNMATSASGALPIVLNPNGRVRSVVANFGGGTANRFIYGCDSVNQAFVFDGTTYAPINTSLNPALDMPNRIAAHKQHLFLAYGNSLQNSGTGNPYQWEPLVGAAELAMNDDITALRPLPGDQTSGAMAVYTKSDTSVLYGTSTADFLLSQFNTGTGARSDTDQTLDQCYVLSDRGVTGLAATLSFGNFESASLTNKLRPFVSPRLQTATASAVNRERGQYRVFFSDGYALYMTIANGQYVGAMPVQFPVPVLCACEGSTQGGEDTTFFGSSNGFVYQMDAGTSFDGEEIQAQMTLVYNSIRSPRITKTFRKASIELTGDAYASFSFNYDIAYGSTSTEQQIDTDVEKDLRSAYWDSLTWDEFIYDGQGLTPAEVEMDGTAENVAVRISSASSILKPFTVNSLIIHYTLRRGLR